MTFYCWYSVIFFVYYIEPDLSKQLSENRTILLPHPVLVKYFYIFRIYLINDWKALNGYLQPQVSQHEAVTLCSSNPSSGKMYCPTDIFRSISTVLTTVKSHSQFWEQQRVKASSLSVARSIFVSRTQYPTNILKHYDRCWGKNEVKARN